MLHIFAQTTDDQPVSVITQTQTTVHAWVDPAIAVALVFALAGSIFISIYFLRARRKQSPSAE
jgi:hypothetical protein